MIELLVCARAGRKQSRLAQALAQQKLLLECDSGATVSFQRRACLSLYAIQNYSFLEESGFHKYSQHQLIVSQ